MDREPCRPSVLCSQELAALTSDSNAPDGPAPSSARSIPSASESSPVTGPVLSDGMTCEAFQWHLQTGTVKPHPISPALDAMPMAVLISSAEASPARISPSPGSGPASLESAAGSSGSSCGWPTSCNPDGCCLRMFQGFLALAVGATSGRCSKDWNTAGTGGPTGYWTASISESPSDGAACSLSAIVEGRVPPRFFLSPKAARGILRRAEKRGRELPPALRAALTALASAPQGDGRKTTPISSIKPTMYIVEMKPKRKGRKAR